VAKNWSRFRLDGFGFPKCEGGFLADVLDNHLKDWQENKIRTDGIAVALWPIVPPAISALPRRSALYFPRARVTVKDRP